ncbi:Crp/Fnr family transcriptional regulator [Pseudodesulfovibrio senegalensis]|uniref:Crp/Fnr family transcriptional regulator n=1 Tax=Pseudodesulfovibrio senegalensis TaxID=1721087 RepID=A0A6N6N086_9BACT|nr:Crp/Fnr family transcriptional regulator [Pseudodesulfovibrio senegalensis]KAB1441127.1 Crp/Fnr family transcriptional regulator [Pseudodesulfovibrio senegalensis]
MTGQNTLQSVKSVSIFKDIPEEKQKRLAEIVVQKGYRKGEVIFEADTPASGFYAVISGKVKIYRNSPSGKEQILNIFKTGENFAEVPVFEGTTFPVHAQTLENSILLYVPRVEFARIIASDPDLAMTMMAQLSSRLRILVNKIEDLSLKEAPARVAAHLLLLAGSRESATFTLDLPKGQVAFYLGTIQETLSRILKRFVKDEIIAMNGKEITILDKQALNKIAEQGR